MTIVEWIAILGTILKFAGTLIEKYKTTPAEKRRESLAEFDRGMERAKNDRDLRDLSKWLGGRT